MTTAHILIVDDDAIVTKTMGLILNRLGYKTTPINNPAEALRWLQLPGNHPDLLISDVNMPQMSGFDFVSQVRRNPATTHLPVIMLTANNDIDHKVEGFKAGADDYLTKPVDRTELEWRIKAILARAKKSTPDGPPPEAPVISVFSLRGGVGTTTMAVNMAVSLAYLWGKPVGLLDLALKNGHCAMMLNQRPQHALSSISGWDSSVIEADVIERMLLKHDSGVKTMAACLSPIEAELVTVPTVDRVWPYMRASFGTLVVDAGSTLIEPNLTILERSNYIVLLLAPELASLKAAVDAKKVLLQIGIPAERILPVINWIFPDSGLPQSNIEAALKTEIAAIIPYNKSGFVQAINSGKPEVVSQPSSKCSMAIAALSYKVSASAMESQSAGTASKWLEMARRLAKAA